MGTIREQIKVIKNEIGKGELVPGRAAELLNKLASLLGNINDEIRQSDLEYNSRLLECYEKEEKANRAKIKAETSSEYLRKREARDTKELVIELIRGLKFYLRAKEEEYRLMGGMN